MHCPSTKALCFPVLLICLMYTLPTDAASLCYSFTVNISESGMSHKVQGQLDEKTFITCDNTNCRAIGGLGETLKAIQSWEGQVDTLKDGIDLVTDKALLLKQEIDTIRGTGECTEVDPGSMQIKEMLEKNKDLTDFLSRTSQGDCKAWLKEMIKSHLEEKLESTGLVKDTAGIVTSASQTIAPDVDQSSSMTMQPNAFVLLFALALLVLLKYLQ